MSYSISTRFAISILLTSTCLSSAYADTGAANTVNATNTMSPIIVSATRIPTPADQIASSVTVITSDDIDAKQQHTLPEILQEVAGLNIVQGGAGNVASVFMRGTNANHTKILVDGIDVGDASSVSGGFDFSQITASNIERVEVLRGPQSGLYGSDAIGGVINIVTKTGKGPAQFTASVEAGSFGTFNQTAGVSGSTDKLNYSLNVEHLRTDANPVTPSNLVPAGRPRNNDYYNSDTASTKLGAKLTDNLDIGFVGRYTFAQINNTGDDFTGPEALRTNNTNHDFFTRGTAHLVSFDGKLEQTVGLAYTDYRRDYVDPNAMAYSSFGQYQGDRLKTDWQGNIKIMQGQTVTLGLEHQLDQMNDPSQPIRAQMTNNAGFVQLQSEFGKQLFNTISVRDDDNSMFGSKATYRIAPAFLITQTDTKLKASFGTGFKAPTLDELFNNYPAFGFSANPNLKPETSKGYDLGFEQNLFKKKVQFGSTYFHNSIKNLIADNAAYTTYINVGKATTYGFENFVSYKPLNILTLRADYTFTIANDDIAQHELLRRPKNKASLSATYQATDKLSLTSSVLYVGKSIDGNRDFSVSRMKSGSYTTANIAAEYAVNDKISVFGRVTNLFDRHYQQPIGFDQQGIGAFAGVKAKF